MGNLGGYQTAVELMKKFGGPGKALAIGVTVIGAAGYGVLRGVEFGGKKTFAAVQHRRTKVLKETPTFRIHTDGMDEQGLTFTVGDTFTAGMQIEDVVLIELEGNVNNPWAVSPAFLTQISDYLPDGTGEDAAEVDRKQRK